MASTEEPGRIGSLPSAHRGRGGRTASVVAAAAVLGLSAASVLFAPQDRVLLIGDHAVQRAPTVALVIWSAAVLIAAVVLGRSALGRRPRRGPRPAATALGLLPAIALVLAGAWTIGFMVLRAAADAVAGTELSTVEGPGESGCTAVVEVTRTLDSTTVRLYPIGPWGIGSPGGQTMANHPQHPIRDHEYALTTRPGGGELRLRTTPAFVPDTVDFTCGDR